MKKLYWDVSEADGCIGLWKKDTEIIPAGTTVYSMQVKDKCEEYERIAREYQVHFIFDDQIPGVDFYTVPWVDLFAVDEDGGYLGTAGQLTELQGDAPICYIDRDRRCYRIADCGQVFLSGLPRWKTMRQPWDGVTVYPSREKAEENCEFIEIDMSAEENV